MPNAANLVKLSRALKVRSDWLLGLPDWDNCPPYFASARIDDLFAKLATATAADIEIVATIADAILDRTNRLKMAAYYEPLPLAQPLARTHP